MGMEKYSPTVREAYRQDQDWFRKNGGDSGNGLDPDSFYDDDGYDSYGYDENEVDREGISEFKYLESFVNGNDEDYSTYNAISDSWGFDGIKPVMKK